MRNRESIIGIVVILMSLAVIVLAYDMYDTSTQKRLLYASGLPDKERSLTSYVMQPYQVTDNVVAYNATNIYTRYKSGTVAQFIKRQHYTNGVTVYQYSVTNWTARTNVAVSWSPING